MSSTSGETDTEAQEAPPRDELREGLLERLAAELGDDVLDSRIEKADLWVRVAAPAWHRAVEACKTRLGCDYFCFLSGIDWMPSTAPNPEEAVADEEGAAPAAPPEPAAAPAASAEIETGYAGGESRFQVFARLYNTSGHYGVTLKADLDPDAPQVASIVDLFRGAEWHEREAWEMFGFTFVGHPALRHLFLPGQFEGHPLRKDFPLLAREVKPWPGIVDVEPMPGDEDEGEGGEG